VAQSKTTTVGEYLAELEPERREALEPLIASVRESVPGEFEERYRASGKRMDVGKSCVRFTKLDDVPLDVVGWAVAQIGVEHYVERYEASR
jgi:hypothetical protein